MAIVYLTFDSVIDLDASDDVTKKFKGTLNSTNWTITEFLLGKNELKIYHNEFFKGAHYVESGSNKKYIIKGIVKMTVKPKVAELLLAGKTEWIVTQVKVTHEDEKDNRTDLTFTPSKSGATVSVHSTLDKPAK
jgi:hypothetical protein